MQLCLSFITRICSCRVSSCVLNVRGRCGLHGAPRLGIMKVLPHAGRRKETEKWRVDDQPGECLVYKAASHIKESVRRAAEEREKKKGRVGK